MEPATINHHLLAINRQSFTQRHYETSYYALIAAMHHAREVDDAEAMQAIEHLADEQAEYLEMEKQQTPPSLYQARQRLERYAVLYRMLVHQASILTSLLKRRQSSTF